MIYNRDGIAVAYKTESGGLRRIGPRSQKLGLKLARKARSKICPALRKIHVIRSNDNDAHYPCSMKTVGKTLGTLVNSPSD